MFSLLLTFRVGCFFSLFSEVGCPLQLFSKRVSLRTDGILLCLHGICWSYTATKASSHKSKAFTGLTTLYNITNLQIWNENCACEAELRSIMVGINKEKNRNKVRSTTSGM